MNICSLWLLSLLVGCIFSKKVTGAKSFKRGQNVGTVLFERDDYGKQCWTSEEFTVLSSRTMFQNILPQVKIIDTQNGQYVAHLMGYFHICLESVRKLSVGKTKHLMLKALADTLGGYLRVHILPLTRHSYYAGNIKYRHAKMLFELLDELKAFLRTNGAGWSKLSQNIGNVRIPPITITPSKTSAACNGLITYSTSSDNKDYRSFTFKKRKRSTVKLGHARRAIDGYGNEAVTSEVIVPLPFLDNEAEPNSIALPFKIDNLQSLYSEKSAFALVKYYIISTQCIASQPNTRTQLQTFNKDFYVWLQQSVRRKSSQSKATTVETRMNFIAEDHKEFWIGFNILNNKGKVRPHLDDEKWYPAFGGVLRVMATLRESGIGDGIMKSKASGTYQVMPKVDAERTSQTDESVSPLYKGKGESNDNTMAFGTTEIVIIAVVSALVIWLLVGLSLVCYKFLIKHTERCPPCESKTIPFAVLYENADYCEPETCPSKQPHKGVVEKLKEWWRNRFGRCPGGCQEHADDERCLAAISYSSKDDVSNNSGIYPWTKKKYTKSTSALPLGTFRGRTTLKHVCYSSEGSTTCSDSPTKSR